MNYSKTMDSDNKEIPDFSNVERAKIPEPFTWNLKDIYPNIEGWEKAKEKMLAMTEKIPAMAKDWTSTPQKMFQLLHHISEIDIIENSTYSYASMSSDTDMANSGWQARKGEIYTASVNLQAMLSFIDPDILSLGEEKIAEYMEIEPGLKEYRMDFQKVLRMKDHILPEEKERIVAQSHLFSSTPSKAAGILNNVDMPIPRIKLQDGRRIPLNMPNYVRYRESTIEKDRVKVMRKYWTHHAGFRNTHAALLDGAMKSHLFHAKVRNYDNCLQSALYHNNIDPQVYHNLIETVENNLETLQRYMVFKARMLDKKLLSYDDIYVSSVPKAEKKFTMDEAKGMVMDALKPLGSEYTNVLSGAFNDNWMDIYPNKGKRSGAYSNGSCYNVHPYVLMNYNGTYSHVSTLAHEFGHSLHSWFSNKTQPFPMARYPIFLAEVASTFNETLLVNYMLENETDENFKLFLLDRYLEDMRGTLFRQTLFAHFELDMHRHVEKNQTLTADWLDETYLKLTRLYYGHNEKITRVDKYLENEWSGIPHFYYNFYVFQYSTGISAATSLAKMVMEGGEAERKRYLNFLSGGCSQYPLDTLKDAGVDLTSALPIQTTINKFGEILDKIEGKI